MKELICELKVGQSIDYIKNSLIVNYRYGVWNDYTLIDTKYAIEQIRQSPFGADIYFDEDEGYFVSIPTNGDMY